DRYRELGYEHVFDVPESKDHKVQGYAYKDARLIGWLRVRKRPEAPEHVRLVTGDLRYDRAYWVRLVPVRDSELPGTDGHELAKSEPSWHSDVGELTVTTRNVAAFAIAAKDLALPPNTRIVIDGEAQAVPDGAASLFFDRTADHWVRRDEEPSRSGKKRTG